LGLTFSSPLRAFSFPAPYIIPDSEILYDDEDTFEIKGRQFSENLEDNKVFLFPENGPELACTVIAVTRTMIKVKLNPPALETPTGDCENVGDLFATVETDTVRSLKEKVASIKEASNFPLINCISYYLSNNRSAELKCILSYYETTSI
jgi:hypothetical protein